MTPDRTAPWRVLWAPASCVQFQPHPREATRATQTISELKRGPLGTLDNVAGLRVRKMRVSV